MYKRIRSDDMFEVRFYDKEDGSYDVSLVYFVTNEEFSFQFEKIACEFEISYRKRKPGISLTEEERRNINSLLDSLLESSKSKVRGELEGLIAGKIKECVEEGLKILTSELSRLAEYPFTYTITKSEVRRVKTLKKDLWDWSDPSLRGVSVTMYFKGQVDGRIKGKDLGEDVSPFMWWFFVDSISDKGGSLRQLKEEFFKFVEERLRQIEDQLEDEINKRLRDEFSPYIKEISNYYGKVETKFSLLGLSDFKEEKSFLETEKGEVWGTFSNTKLIGAFENLAREGKWRAFLSFLIVFTYQHPKIGEWTRRLLEIFPEIEAAAEKFKTKPQK